jgi:hypothetical protein
MMAHASQMSATVSSTMGYIGEIDSVQQRQRARSTSQLTNGTFSYQAS